ncbi:putative harbinger transposase-derived nuclease domain-containing protein [Lupinus albus]|uniref:Putative harbinger transposase-derived nuclease domain-containing protein n=1 Tax=Lupinus albus TaxID=3870 RepID=A0A6A4NEP8_LUPAL|nr:putative harbinger transposase-derived nuclease domain-containing protein [Lupinus albus]
MSTTVHTFISCKDPESLSFVYTFLQTSFDQIDENDPNNNITTKNHSRQNNDDESSNSNNQEGGGRTSNIKRNKKKKELKAILTSLLLVEQQEKLDQQHFNEVSKEEKKSLDTNHKNKTKAMLQYCSYMDDYYNQVQESDHVKRKKTRSMASTVAVASAAVSEEGFDSKEGVPQRRLWVKDRSGAWWDECNRFDFPEDEFRKAFRMGRSTFELICEELNSAIVKEDTTLRNAIPVRQRVAVCLWRLATGDPLRVVSKRFGLGISTCHKLVLEVCTAIKSVLMPKYLQWPDEVFLRKMKGEFESISGIPNVVGSMYTSHVPIIAPKISVGAYFNKRHTERNQKTCYSITIQGVVDPRGVFTDICIGWPGSMPDDQVLEKSALNQSANNGGILKGVWIVGGSSYPLMDWVMVPYTQKNLTWTQHGFNEKIGEIQMVAKDAFARLKGRWCCLQKRTEVKLQDLPHVLGACCVLHNICELRGEKMDPELKFDLVDDEMVPEVALRSLNSMNARDAIAHNLLHHGLAGTSFV